MAIKTTAKEIQMSEISAIKVKAKICGWEPHKLYTVSTPQTGIRSCLNGQMFEVVITSKGTLMFCKQEGGYLNVFLRSSPIEDMIAIEINKTRCGLSIKTASGQVYDLIEVESLLPTTLDGRNRYE